LARSEHPQACKKKNKADDNMLTIARFPASPGRGSPARFPGATPWIAVDIAGFAFNQKNNLEKA
jgi:hypothetical protein